MEHYNMAGSMTHPRFAQLQMTPARHKEAFALARRFSTP